MKHASDREGTTFGMWLFLCVEILFFGGLFLLYAAYLRRFPDSFHVAVSGQSIVFGTANTVIMLISSWAVAMALSGVHRGFRLQSRRYTFLAFGLGIIFMLNKVLEWQDKISSGIYPDSSLLQTKPDGEVLFYGLYYLMTGLHGIHVIIGSVLLLVAYVFLRAERINQNNYAFLENAGLYWHSLTLVWVFIFPLFYLIA